MSRTRASAKAAGTSHETRTTAYLKLATGNPYITRQVKTGSRDMGDVANVRHRSGRNVVVECKDYGGRFLVSEWLNEAEVERVNATAFAGVVVAKRRGIADPAQQVVMMTLQDFAALLTGERPPAYGPWPYFAKGGAE